MTVLVSVNVGLPKEVSWEGRTVLTGVWKSPTTGRTAICGTNLAGDGQGDLVGHGGVHRAVLVYQTQAYDYWSAELGRDDLSPGAFGDNFTVDGLADDVVCIGDRYRIGDALFEVSQPRVTCFRVGMRVGEPRLPALMVAHHRPGFYLRVLEEGTVGPGDLIDLVHRDPHGLTVAEVDALLYLPDRDLERVALAASCEPLSPGWRQSFDEMLTERSDAAATPPTVTGRAPVPPAWEGFRPLRVASVHVESEDVTSFELADASGDVLPAAFPGQYLTLRVADEAGGSVVRSYSLSRADTRSGYRVSVKREGTGSRRIHEVLTAGADVEVAAPRGEFRLPDGEGPVVFISAGIGITPLLAMIDDLAGRRSAREVIWLHAARSPQSQVFADEVAQRLARLPRSRSVVFLSRPAGQIAAPGILHGRITAERLRELRLPLDATYCLCGPSSFMATITGALALLGVPAASIREEAFGAEAALNPGVVGAVLAAPHAPEHPGNGPVVTFVRSGISARWNGDVYSSLLEFAEACDIPTRWSCRSGVCHTCLTGLLAGRVAYRPEPLERPGPSQALICCSTPAAGVVLDA